MTLTNHHSHLTVLFQSWEKTEHRGPANTWRQFEEAASSWELADRSIYRLEGKFPVGRYDDHGWVHLYIGGRALKSALDKADANYTIGAEHLADVLMGIRSPFHIDEKASSIGIFIDGTGNHLESLTNVTRLYNAYKGTKFYHGGVGNMVDYDGLTEGAANRHGLGWTNTIKRAEADVLSALRIMVRNLPTSRIRVDVFGWA